MDNTRLDDLVQKILQALPPGLVELKSDLEKNLRAGLSSTLAKLDLVSREEWEVQIELLARTRTKLEQMEKRIAELEAQLQQRDPSQ